MGVPAQSGKTKGCRSRSRCPSALSAATKTLLAPFFSSPLPVEDQLKKTSVKKKPVFKQTKNKIKSTRVSFLILRAQLCHFWVRSPHPFPIHLCWSAHDYKKTIFFPPIVFFYYFVCFYFVFASINENEKWQQLSL